MTTALYAYAALETLTARMADAANRGDFDALASMADDFSRLADALPKELPTSPHDKAEVAAAIRQIMASQDEVLSLTSPHMEYLRKLFVATRKESAVASAYRTTG